ncbi:MAG: DUF805 domain-containing protein [Akkermansia sp.]|nr:DUF805 domain-containing protein [Akkermansia sp.]
MATEQAPVTTDLLCPRCRAALEVSNNRLPENCPGCGLLLRARRQKAYNHNFVLVWKKALVWRGRAPRREFWGYAIIMGGIGLLLALLLDIVCNGFLMSLVREYVYPVPQLPGLAAAVLGSMAGAAILVWLVAVPLPLFSVTVRRLHDVGRSMLLPVLTLLLAVPGILLPALLCIPALLGEPAGAERVSEHIVPALFASGVLAVVFGLIVLMLCLMDSERGTNKYGPSIKYPLE